MILLALLTGLLPVVLLLSGMVVMDCYKLVTRRRVMGSLAWGAAAGVISWAAHALARDRLGVPHDVLRWLAPALEESLKLAWVVVLIRRGLVGFPVDAAIHGFAIGAGFAVVENLYYAATLRDASLLLWLARGLGTAVMHGGVTAIAAVFGMDLTKRRSSRHLAWFVPGLALAVALHTLFNRLPLPPLLATACVILGVPAILVAVYELSEARTRRWLGTTMDSDAELLELIHSGAITSTPVGRYLASLRERFPGPVVADMLCLLEIHAGLAMRAKGLLLAREAGLSLPPDREVEDQLRELSFLERSIGATGRLAIAPFLPAARDRWQIHVLAPHGPGKIPAA
jgi:RsiW-degrading membrane proteinase PrsW (M82 family)